MRIRRFFEEVRSGVPIHEAKKKLAGNSCVLTGQGSGGGFVACNSGDGSTAGAAPASTSSTETAEQKSLRFGIAVDKILKGVLNIDASATAYYSEKGKVSGFDGPVIIFDSPKVIGISVALSTDFVDLPAKEQTAALQNVKKTMKLAESMYELSGGSLRKITFTAGANKHDPYFEQALGITGFESAATADSDHAIVNFYGLAKRAGSESTAVHEIGHLVSLYGRPDALGDVGGMSRNLFMGIQSLGGDYAEKLRTPERLAFFAMQDEYEAAFKEASDKQWGKPNLSKVGTPSFGHGGVTSYGSTNWKEDFAESYMLAHQKITRKENETAQSMLDRAFKPQNRLESELMRAGGEIGNENVFGLPKHVYTRARILNAMSKETLVRKAFLDRFDAWAKGKVDIETLLPKRAEAVSEFFADVRSGMSILEAKKKLVGNLCVLVGQGSGGGFANCNGPDGSGDAHNASGNLEFSRLSKVGAQAGSNPGGFFEDSKTGEKWYVKFPESEDYARNEVLAAELYRIAGVKVPHLTFVEGAPSGRIGVASKIVDGLRRDRTGLTGGSVSGVRRGFGADAWLANWDVVGLEYDNLLKGKDGQAIRVDTGGALRYRAQGGEKGALFGSSVGELTTMREPHRESGSVFSNLTTDQVKRSVQKVLDIPEPKIRAAVEKFGPKDDATREKLLTTLLARRRDMARRVGIVTESLDEAKKKLQGNSCVLTGEGSGGGFVACNGAAPTAVPVSGTRSSKFSKERLPTPITGEAGIDYMTDPSQMDTADLDKASLDWFKGLTPEQQEAVNGYTGGGSAIMHRMIRGEIPKKEPWGPRIELMNEALKTGPKNPFMSFRGDQLRPELAAMFEAALNGSDVEMVCDAFTSVSLDSSTGTAFANRHIENVVYRVMGGGTYIAPNSGDPKEYEAVFPLGARFKIKKVRKNQTMARGFFAPREHAYIVDLEPVSAVSEFFAAVRSGMPLAEAKKKIQGNSCVLTGQGSGGGFVACNGTSAPEPKTMNDDPDFGYNPKQKEIKDALAAKGLKAMTAPGGWLIQGHPGVHTTAQAKKIAGIKPQKKAAPTSPAAREYWDDGRMVPKAGDEVFQQVGAFGGTSAIINGVVYDGANGPRVRVTSANSATGIDKYSGASTVKLNHNWTVKDDPYLAKRAAAEKAREDARTARYASEHEKASHRAADAAAKAIQNGEEKFDFKTVRVGDLITNHYYGRTEIVTRVDPAKGDKPIGLWGAQNLVDGEYGLASDHPDSFASDPRGPNAQHWTVKRKTFTPVKRGRLIAQYFEAIRSGDSLLEAKKVIRGNLCILTGKGSGSGFVSCDKGGISARKDAEKVKATRLAHARHLIAVRKGLQDAIHRRDAVAAAKFAGEIKRLRLKTSRESQAAVKAAEEAAKKKVADSTAADAAKKAEKPKPKKTAKKEPTKKAEPKATTAKKSKESDGGVPRVAEGSRAAHGNFPAIGDRLEDSTDFAATHDKTIAGRVWAADLSKHETEAVDEYTSSGYEELTNFQRHVGAAAAAASPSRLGKLLRDLQSAVTKAPRPVGRITYRGSPLHSELQAVIEAFEKGSSSEMEFGAFTSASLDSKIAQRFGGLSDTVRATGLKNVIFRIDDHGGYIAHGSKHQVEAEVLYSPSDRFKIVAVTRKVKATTDSEKQDIEGFGKKAKKVITKYTRDFDYVVDVVPISGPGSGSNVREFFAAVRDGMSILEAKKKLAGNSCVLTGQGSGGGFVACNGTDGGSATAVAEPEKKRVVVPAKTARVADGSRAAHGNFPAIENDALVSTPYLPETNPLRRASTDWAESLPTAQAEAVDGYTNADYEAMTELQRDLGWESAAGDESKIGKLLYDLHEAVDSAPSPVGHIAYRGSELHPSIEKSIAAFEKGSDVEMEFGAFTSASLYSRIAQNFGTISTVDRMDKKRNVIFRIDDHGAFIDAASSQEGEGEVLYSPSSRFKIAAVTRKVKASFSQKWVIGSTVEDRPEVFDYVVDLVPASNSSGGSKVQEFFAAVRSGVPLAEAKKVIRGNLCILTGKGSGSGFVACDKGGISQRKDAEKVKATRAATVKKLLDTRNKLRDAIARGDAAAVEKYTAEIKGKKFGRRASVPIKPDPPRAEVPTVKESTPRVAEGSRPAHGNFPAIENGKIPVSHNVEMDGPEFMDVKAWYDGLSNEQQESINFYTGSLYRDMNLLQRLFGPRGPADDDSLGSVEVSDKIMTILDFHPVPGSKPTKTEMQVRHAIPLLHDALASAPSIPGRMVYRGDTMRDDLENAVKAFKKGSDVTIEVPNFTSASLRTKVAAEFSSYIGGDRVVYRIDNHGAHVGPASLNFDEAEVIYRAGQRFRIKAVTENVMVGDIAKVDKVIDLEPI